MREHLKETLPEHMVPTAFVALDSLPLTPSGKLDRRALPTPDPAAYMPRACEPPRGELEQFLALIWRELLGLDQVGRRDNFFELGGHSLMATQLVVRVNSVM